MRISRPCYDKYHRCPGWNGGGTRSARTQRCDGGYLGAAYERRAWKWRLYRCPKCGVRVLPWMIRYLDWRYWWSWKRRDLLRWLTDMQAERKIRKITTGERRS